MHRVFSLTRFQDGMAGLKKSYENYCVLKVEPYQLSCLRGGGLVASIGNLKSQALKWTQGFFEEMHLG